MELAMKGLRVLVTAGASGIGRSTALAFKSEGARVHICDVDPDAIAAFTAQNPEISATRADVSDREQVSHLFDEALRALGGLDVLVNNAGVAGPTAPVDAVAPEDWDRCLAVNITGQFNCARLAVPHLKSSRNASIINMSSAAGRLGFAMRTPYAASKWAVVGFSKSLAIELGGSGIRVNAILPGLVEGDRINRVFEAKAKARNIAFEAMRDEALSTISLHTTVTAEQISDTIIFLCSKRGATISGQAISVCGDLQMLV
jgi:NAD(P)-dependent dehydrogenase (short-subunit alcohol dehydrogenase family)